MSELKPCPFCGGESHYNSSMNMGYRDTCGKYLCSVEVGCVRCGANVEVVRRCDLSSRDELEEQAEQLWNTRVIDRDELLDIAEDLDCGWAQFNDDTVSCEDVDKFEREMADRIRKAVDEQ